mmetsp:Transcript_50705/g.121112  ORF Transcript_50705/g.121112 Transcript_50705/m.121112 type:complete len:91 (+) Transcript_50705:1024-1296(+)
MLYHRAFCSTTIKMFRAKHCGMNCAAHARMSVLMMQEVLGHGLFLFDNGAQCIWAPVTGPILHTELLPNILDVSWLRTASDCCMAAGMQV